MSPDRHRRVEGRISGRSRARRGRRVAEKQSGTLVAVVLLRRHDVPDPRPSIIASTRGSVSTLTESTSR